MQLSHEEDLIAQNIYYLLPDEFPVTRRQLEIACALLEDADMFETEDIEYVKYLIMKNLI